MQSFRHESDYYTQKTVVTIDTMFSNAVSIYVNGKFGISKVIYTSIMYDYGLKGISMVTPVFESLFNLLLTNNIYHYYLYLPHALFTYSYNKVTITMKIEFKNVEAKRNQNLLKTLPKNLCY